MDKITWFSTESITKAEWEKTDRIYCNTSDERAAVAHLAGAWGLRKGGIEVAQNNVGWYVRYNFSDNPND